MENFIIVSTNKKQISSEKAYFNFQLCINIFSVLHHTERVNINVVYMHRLHAKWTPIYVRAGTFLGPFSGCLLKGSVPKVWQQ